MDLPVLLSTLTALCFIRMSHAADAIIDSDILASEFAKIAENGMGVTNMQKYYDELEYDVQAVSGPQLLNQISTTLESKFKFLVDAAKSIRDEVHKEHGNFEKDLSKVGIEQCCKATGVSNDTKFRSEVRIGESCITQSLTSPPDRKFPNKKVEEIMKNNYKTNSNLLWQYFGTEDGTSIYYPKVKIKDCEDYDPRSRPFYSAAASPKSKDVVVVIEKSRSMETIEANGKNRMYIAREITKTVVNTLNRNDRVGLVAFDENAYTTSDSSSCYQQTLAVATDDNKRKLISYTNRLGADDGSDYGKALKSAFKFFSSSSSSLNGESRDQMILFLTDGTDTGVADSPLDVIKVENGKLGNRVYVMTFGIGKDISQSKGVVELLRNMSHQVYNNASHGTTKEGFSEYFEDEAHLRSKLSVYYGFFRPSLHENPSYSVPFPDTFSSIGLVVSVCLPAYGNSVFLGVACADIKLHDIFAEVTVFNQDELSYIFVIDKSGRTLHHPLLPVPRTIKEDITMPNIINLERSKSAEQVIQSMKKMESGNMTFTSTRTYARGKVLYDGIVTKSLKSHYYWKPIQGSDYCLCVVVGDGDVKQTMQTLPTSKEVFFYNRRDLQQDDFPSCQIVKRWSTKERSAIHFTGNAFTKPSLYTDYEDKPVDVLRYTKYFTEVGVSNPGFKDNVFNSLVATYEAEKFWKEHTDLATFAIWRFIGTKDGVFRTYPHHAMPKDYDHEFRPWWRRAVVSKGVLVITTPYVDASGSGIIAALCHSIYKGSKKTHTTDDKVEAVMGWDVSLQFLNHLLLKSYPACSDTNYYCLLVDDSGFIVIHPDFVDPIIDNRNIKLVHIVDKTEESSHQHHQPENNSIEIGLETVVVMTDEEGKQTEESSHQHDQPENNSIEIGLETTVVMTDEEGKQEGDIAESLLGKGIMSKYSCSDLENHKIQQTYRVHLPTGQNGVNQMSDPVTSYEFWPVSGTNVFIIIRKKTTATKCCKQNINISPEVTQCQAGTSCDCLCYNPLPFNPCLNTNNLRDIGNTCSAKAPGLEKTIDVELEEQKIQGLPLCYDPECSSRTTEFDCYKVVGCSWCVRTKAGDICKRPFCTEWTQCPFGELKDSETCPSDATDATTTEAPDTVTSGESSDDNELTYALAISLSVVIVILGAIICAIVYYKVCRNRHKPEDDYMTPTGDYLTAISRESVGITPGMTNELCTYKTEPDILNSVEGIPPIPTPQEETRYVEK